MKKGFFLFVLTCLITLSITAQEFVDLGLPSGTLWKNFDQSGYLDLDDAIEMYGSKLPTADNLKELKEYCEWTMYRGQYIVTGPNGNQIIFNCKGYQAFNSYTRTYETKEFDYGYYWGTDVVWNSSYNRNDYQQHLLIMGVDRLKVAENCYYPSVRKASVHLVQRNRAYEERKKQEAKMQEEAKKRAELRASGWADLGLPSGTLWKLNNEAGLYTYAQAKSKFGYRLPTKKQWEELQTLCKKEKISNGYRFTGHNGESIVLPSEGYRDIDGKIYNAGTRAVYWVNDTPADSESPYHSHIGNGISILSWNQKGISMPVRLVR